MEVSSVTELDGVRLLLEVALRPTAEPETVDRVATIVSVFADACGYGMCGGTEFRPEDATRPEVLRAGAATPLRFDIATRNVAPGSIRLLLGMLKGDFGLARATASLAATVAYGPPPRLVRPVVDERQIAMPRLFSPLGFAVTRHEIARSRGTRLVRVRFRAPVPDEYATRLAAIQKTWVLVCHGGFAEGEVPAHESFLSAGNGYLVSPRTYEIPISMFEAPEHAFDPLLNALRRCSLLDHGVEMVQIW
jgi:hypothetical protein